MKNSQVGQYMETILEAGMPTPNLILRTASREIAHNTQFFPTTFLKKGRHVFTFQMTLFDFGLVAKLHTI
jgi:hypothetical protein